MPFLYLSVCLSRPVRLSFSYCHSIYHSVDPSIHLSINQLSYYLFLSIYSSICCSIVLSIYTLFCFSVCTYTILWYHHSISSITVWSSNELQLVWLVGLLVPRPAYKWPEPSETGSLPEGNKLLFCYLNGTKPWNELTLAFIACTSSWEKSVVVSVFVFVIL